MKTSFPLFARLLLWFFVNLLALIVGLLIMVRVQFGSLDNWLLPQSAQNEIQAMTVDLIGNLAHTNRADWGGELYQLSGAYRMDFALFNAKGEWIAGAALKPPEDIRHAMIFAQPSRPASEGLSPGPGILPESGPGDFNPQPGTPLPDALPPPPGAEQRPDAPWGRPPPPDGAPPPQGAPPRPGGRPMPEFPKSVLRSHEVPGYWLLVRLPPEPLKSEGQVTLVGMTPALGISPLLFNPKPWLAVAAGVILFSILFWIPMARNLTKSIGEMTRATELIAEGRFDVQLADSRRDELGRLSGAINRMATRLKDFVTGQKRFLGDAAHELCSPLVRMEIALGILEERSTDEATLAYVRDVREEVTHMRKLANELLSFSKASLGENHVKLEVVDVGEMVDAAIRLERSGGGEIELDVPEGLFVRGNFELLHRALANLVRNALRYAGEAGPISVTAALQGEDVVVTVADRGPGVAAAELEKLFDPFYRVDPSRTSETGGVGLGLAIVKSCVEACGGSVVARNREPHGLEVRMRLVGA